MPARSPRCGPTTCWPRSSPRSSSRARLTRTRSRTSSSAAPTRRARTAAASRATPGCSPGCRSKSPGSVLQRNCGSGLNAIVMAAQAVTCGEGDVFVAGGVESMSRAPFVMSKAETPFSRDGRIFDSTIGARFPEPEDRGPLRRATRCPRPPTIWRATIRSPARRATSSPRPRSANTPPPRPTGSSTARSSPSRCRAAAPGRSRSPRTSIRARRPIWRRSPNCGRCRRAG